MKRRTSGNETYQEDVNMDNLLKGVRKWMDIMTLEELMNTS